MAKNTAVVEFVPSLNMGDIDSKMLKSMGKISTEIGKAFGKAMATVASGGGGVRALEKTAKKFERMQDTIRRADAQAQARIEKAQKADLKVRAALVAKETKAAEKQAKTLEASTMKSIKLEQRANDRYWGRRKQLMGESERIADKRMAERAEDFGDAIAGAFENLRSPQGWASIGKSISKGMETKGAGMAAQGGAKGGIGEGLLRLGGTLALLAGAAAGLAALAKIFMDVESQAKEMNRTILQGAGALDVTGVAALKLEENLGAIRKAAISDQTFKVLGLKKDEALQVLGAFSEAGFTFKEIRQNAQNATEAVQAYEKALTGATKYARALGEAPATIAANMAEMMEQYNMGLGKIEEKFGAVSKMAMQAGFGAKRFYSMVLQAVSGMGLYNMQMEEAGALLLQVSKSLNPKMAAEFVQGIGTGFKDESIKDSYIRVKKMGGAAAQSIFAQEAQKRAETYLATYGGNIFKDLGADVAVGDLSKPEELQRVAKILVKELGKVGEGGEGALRAQIRRRSGSEQEAMAITPALGASQGAVSSDDLTAKARHMDVLSGVSVLRAKAEAMKGIIGSSVEKITDFNQLVSFQEVSGIGGAEFKSLDIVMKDLHGAFENIQKGADVMSTDEGIALTKQFGMVKKGGQVFKAVLDKDEGYKAIGEPIENSLEGFTKYLGTIGDEQLAAMTGGEETQDEMLLLTREISNATLTLSDRIEHGMNQILEGIWGTVSQILTWIKGTEFTPQELAAKSEATASLLTEAMTFRKEAAKSREAIIKLKAEYDRPGTTPERRTAIAKEIADQRVLEREQIRFADAKKLGAEALGNIQDKGQYTALGAQIPDLIARVAEAWGFGKVTPPQETAAGFGVRGTAAGMDVLKQQKETALSKIVLPDEVLMAITDNVDRELRDLTAPAGDLLATLEGLRWNEGGTTEEETAREARYAEIVQKLEGMGFPADMPYDLSLLSDWIKGEREKRVKERIEKAMGLKLEKDTQKIDKDTLGVTENLPEDIAKAEQKLVEERAVKDLLAQLGLERTPEEIQDILAGKEDIGLTAAIEAAGTNLRYVSEDLPIKQRITAWGAGAGAGAGTGTTAQDFLVRMGSHGTELVSKFSPSDELSVLGSRSGGALDMSAKAATRGAGGGSRGSVVIHINGGNQDEVYRTVKRALEVAGVIPA